MKTRSFLALVTAATFAVAASSFAQAPGEGATATATATAKSSEKPKPLAAGDKSFVKNSLETAYYVMSLTDKKMLDNVKSEDAKKAAQKLNGDLNKVWSELAPIATADGQKLPGAIAPSDKSKVDRLTKAQADKYDKEWLKLLTKETKKLSTLFANAAKSQDAQIKKLAGDWATTIKLSDDDLEKAEKDAAKTK